MRIPKIKREGKCGKLQQKHSEERWWSTRWWSWSFYFIHLLICLLYIYIYNIWCLLNWSPKVLPAPPFPIFPSFFFFASTVLLLTRVQCIRGLSWLFKEIIFFTLLILLDLYPALKICYKIILRANYCKNVVYQTINIEYPEKVNKIEKN